jgi:hypothetical protein
MKKKIKQISPIIERMIEQSSASPKRKEMTTKLMTSGYMDKLKMGAKGVGDEKAMKKMFKKAGWTNEQLKAMPEMMIQYKDGLNSAVILGAAELAKQDSEEGRKAKEWLEKLSKKAPEYVKDILSTHQSTEASMQQMAAGGELDAAAVATGGSPEPVAEQKLRENIRLRLAKIMGRRRR